MVAAAEEASAFTAPVRLAVSAEAVRVDIRRPKAMARLLAATANLTLVVAEAAVLRATTAEVSSGVVAMAETAAAALSSYVAGGVSKGR